MFGPANYNASCLIATISLTGLSATVIATLTCTVLITVLYLALTYLFAPLFRNFLTNNPYNWGTSKQGTSVKAMYAALPIYYLGLIALVGTLAITKHFFPQVDVTSAGIFTLASVMLIFKVKNSRSSTGTTLYTVKPEECLARGMEMDFLLAMIFEGALYRTRDRAIAKAKALCAVKNSQLNLIVLAVCVPRQTLKELLCDSDQIPHGESNEHGDLTFKSAEARAFMKSVASEVRVVWAQHHKMKFSAALSAINAQRKAHRNAAARRQLARDITRDEIRNGRADEALRYLGDGEYTY